MKKVLFLDTETTGLDATKHGIIQLAMLIEIDGKIEGELLVDVQPFEEDLIVIIEDCPNMIYKRAELIKNMAAIGDISIFPSDIKIENLVNFDFPAEAHQKIIAFLDKHISKFDKADKAYLGGYNVQFDRNFISQFFKKCGDNYLGSYLNWKCLDPLYLLWQMDADGYISLENYKLENVCKHFGIEIEAHNALSYIKATYELYRKLRGAK